MKPYLDINILKTHIIPICTKKLFKKTNNKKMGKSNITISWYNDIKLICKIYGVSLKIKGSGYSYYDGNRTIVIDENIMFKKGYDQDFILKIFFHELAHFIQGKIIDQQFWQDGYEESINKTFSKQLKFELAACDLAYYLWKFYLPHIKKYHTEFRHYRSKSDIKFLKNAVKNILPTL